MLGEKLMTLRKARGYSQQEVADLLSVTRQTVSNWECNQGSPSLEKAVELASIYQISLDDLAGANVEVVAKERVEAKQKDLHVLEHFIGKMANLDCTDMGIWFDDKQVDKATKGTLRIRAI